MNHPSQMLSNLALPPCFDTDCARHTYKDKCFGVIGCSWCEYEWDSVNGVTKRINQPFCSDQNKCSAGILGAPTPYDQMERGSRLIEEDKYFFRYYV